MKVFHNCDCSHLHHCLHHHRHHQHRLHHHRHHQHRHHQHLHLHHHHLHHYLTLDYNNGANVQGSPQLWSPFPVLSTQISAPSMPVFGQIIYYFGNKFIYLFIFPLFQLKSRVRQCWDSVKYNIVILLAWEPFCAEAKISHCIFLLFPLGLRFLDQY